MDSLATLPQLPTTRGTGRVMTGREGPVGEVATQTGEVPAAFAGDGVEAFDLGALILEVVCGQLAGERAELTSVQSLQCVSTKRVVRKGGFEPP